MSARTDTTSYDWTVGLRKVAGGYMDDDTGEFFPDSVIESFRSIGTPKEAREILYTPENVSGMLKQSAVVTAGAYVTGVALPLVINSALSINSGTVLTAVKSLSALDVSKLGVSAPLSLIGSTALDIPEEKTMAYEEIFKQIAPNLLQLAQQTNLGGTVLNAVTGQGWIMRSYRSRRYGSRQFPYKPYKSMSADEKKAYWQGRRVGKVRGNRQGFRRGWRACLRKYDSQINKK